MGLKELFAPRPASATARAPTTRTDYIDLEQYTAGSELFDQTASMMVRVAELTSYDDLRECANYVYKGNLLLLDFSAIAQDDIILRRVTSDLKKLVSDINGDIAGLGKTMMIVAPTGVKIDRQKMRGGF
jgi:filamentous hemagglutinin family protein